MDALQGALIVLIVIQSVIMLIIAIALVVIFISVKRALDKVNGVLQTAENIASGVQSATRSGLANLVGSGLREAVNSFQKRRARNKS